MQSSTEILTVPVFDNKTASKHLIDYVSNYISRISAETIYRSEQDPDDVSFSQCLSSSLQAFLNVLVSKTHLSKSELIQALAYIERLVLRSERLVLRPSNVHLFVLVCIMVANKSTCSPLFLSSSIALCLGDCPISNGSWSRTFHIPVSQLNATERSILDLLDFQTTVSTDTYSRYSNDFIEYSTTTQQAISFDSNRTHLMELPSSSSASTLKVAAS